MDRIRNVALVLLALALPAGAQTAHDYFPLGPGFEWTYDYTLFAGDRQVVTHQVEGMSAEPYGVLCTVAVLTGQAGMPPAVTERIGYADIAGTPHRLWRDRSGSLHRWDPGVPFLPLPGMGANPSLWRGTERFEAPAKPALEQPSTISFELEGTERVLVPAGTFDALRVRETQTSSGVSILRWYAAGVGMVQEAETNADTQTYTMKLTAYRVGGR